jgi:hypothetical protein
LSICYLLFGKSWRHRIWKSAVRWPRQFRGIIWRLSGPIIMNLQRRLREEIGHLNDPSSGTTGCRRPHRKNHRSTPFNY